MSPRSAQQGFTMIELVVVATIAAIMVAIAMPSFKSLNLSGARAQGGTMLLAAFNQARSEAIARNTTVTVCQRNYFASGSIPSCNTGGSWSQGWIVYHDSFDGTSATVANVIAVYEPIGRVTASDTNDAFKVAPTTNPATVTFSSNGRTSTSLSFTICDLSSTLTDSRQVNIAPSGFVSLRKLDSTTTSTACS